jgi:DNA uptake protein ComE-like DNA-binding protein
VRAGRRSRLVAGRRRLRDYMSLALPYVVQRKPAIQPGETDKVIDVEFAVDRTSPAESPEPTTSPTLPDGAPNQTSAPTPCEPAPDPASSVKTASWRESTTVKGISKTTAENIVAGRPFESGDELPKLKGMGGKLLGGASAPRAVRDGATTTLSAAAARRPTASQTPAYGSLPARWSLLCLGNSLL